VKERRKRRKKKKEGKREKQTNLSEKALSALLSKAAFQNTHSAPL
jgi:hypothetical protein